MKRYTETCLIIEKKWNQTKDLYPDSYGLRILCSFLIYSVSHLTGCGKDRVSSMNLLLRKGKKGVYSSTVVKKGVTEGEGHLYK